MLVSYKRKAMKFDGSTAIQNFQTGEYLQTAYQWAVVLRVYVDIETANGGIVWGGNDDNGAPYTSFSVRLYDNRIKVSYYGGSASYSITKSGVYDIFFKRDKPAYAVLNYFYVDDTEIVVSPVYDPYPISIRMGIGAKANYSGYGEFGAPDFDTYSNSYLLEILQCSYGASITVGDFLELASDKMIPYSEHPNFSNWVNNTYYCNFSKEYLGIYENGVDLGFSLVLREGVEQYEYVNVGDPYWVDGELFKREETEETGTTQFYEWNITDWVYGGSFEITVNATGNKTITTSLFESEEDRAYVYDVQTTTGQTITVDLPEKAKRSMIIKVESDVDFTEISYKFELVAPITVYDEGISVGLNTYDTAVNYANNQTLSDTVNVRVAKENSNLFKTITENNIYFMDKERIVLSRSLLSDFDINNYMYALSLTRLL